MGFWEKVITIFIVLLICCGASYRTPNFVVTAPTEELAEKVGKRAEEYREGLATEWLGKKFPEWTHPCPINVELSSGVRGATTFIFGKGEVFGWEMEIKGTEERLLDSVLPHEILHTVFASHFRRPLPRWADEGACISVEHASERESYKNQLQFCLEVKKEIPLDELFRMTEYPNDTVLLYAEGGSLARMLIDLGGKREFVAFLSDGLENDWTPALKRHYGSNLKTLQSDWLSWVRQGSLPIVKVLP